MTVPGPRELGRGVVVRAGQAVPPAWEGAPVVTLDVTVLERPDAVADGLHRHWVSRAPLVVVWDLPDDALAGDESDTRPVWSLDAGFLFPRERLRFLAFTNNYDARDGAPRWWWTAKAAPLGVAPSTVADAVLPDGTDVWIDGGPRQPLPPLGHPVIHGESAERGRPGFVPPAPSAPGGLAPDQEEAVMHGAGAARIIAPAGSGKTRTLTSRLTMLTGAWGIEAELVTALAYNERAARELRERSGADRSTARTIHSLGWEILRQARPGLELISERDARSIVQRLVQVPRRANADPIGPYIEALQAVRSRLADPEEVEGERDDVPGLASMFEIYRERLYRGGAVDHAEQVYGAIEALARDPALRRLWQRRCSHMLVDEFQDLTPAYVLLIRLVASPQLDVFGVGDDDQVIYGYDGADPGFLIGYEDLFPGAGAHALTTNYRCPPAVVDAAANLLTYNRRRIAKTIVAARDDAAPGALDVRRIPGDGMAGHAAELIAGWLEDGAAPDDIAVLSRVNSSLIAVKAALVEAGVPSDDLLSEDSLRRTVISALFAWMRMAMHPDQLARNDVVEAVVRPGRRINQPARQALVRRSYDLDGLWALKDVFEPAHSVRWEDFCGDVARAAAVAAKGDALQLVSFIVDGIGLGKSARDLDAGRSDASRSAHSDDLVAVRRAAAIHRDLDDFVPWLERAVARPRTEGAVTLSSVHRVKGMEWPRVIVLGADAGSFPHDLAEDVEEERRVFHVAVTRAIAQAVVLADEKRPSRFLAEIAKPRPAGEPAQARPVVEPSRRARAAAGPRERGELDWERLDERLVTALRSWRTETARERRVSPFVILHDRTLFDIADRAPRSERDLLAIPGMGPVKLELYGDDLLAIVEEFLRKPG